MQRQPVLTPRDLSLFQLKTRYTRNYLTFAGKNSKDFLLYLSGPGVYDAPEVDMELTSIPGKNGDLIRENAKSGQRRYKNLDITYQAFFFDSLPARTASVKSWLLSPVGYQVLHDTYDPDFFRLALCREALSFEVKGKKGGEHGIKVSLPAPALERGGAKEGADGCSGRHPQSLCLSQANRSSGLMGMGKQSCMWAASRSPSIRLTGSWT